eukprot:GHVP01033912.1.p1 GENE.GHVP01033912.1~~GHVP01033912.1.p1  ORF type:complete len:1526 (+),score=152.01 GHVP01033912.1:228-4805(+)
MSILNPYRCTEKTKQKYLDLPVPIRKHMLPIVEERNHIDYNTLFEQFIQEPIKPIDVDSILYLLYNPYKESINKELIIKKSFNRFIINLYNKININNHNYYYIKQYLPYLLIQFYYNHYNYTFICNLLHNYKIESIIIDSIIDYIKNNNTNDNFICLLIIGRININILDRIFHLGIADGIDNGITDGTNNGITDWTNDGIDSGINQGLNSSFSNGINGSFNSNLSDGINNDINKSINKANTNIVSAGVPVEIRNVVYEIHRIMKDSKISFVGFNNMIWNVIFNNESLLFPLKDIIMSINGNSIDGLIDIERIKNTSIHGDEHKIDIIIDRLKINNHFICELKGYQNKIDSIMIHENKTYIENYMKNTTDKNGDSMSINSKMKNKKKKISDIVEEILNNRILIGTKELIKPILNDYGFIMNDLLLLLIVKTTLNIEVYLDEIYNHLIGSRSTLLAEFILSTHLNKNYIEINYNNILDFIVNSNISINNKLKILIKIINSVNIDNRYEKTLYKIIYKPLNGIKRYKELEGTHGVISEGIGEDINGVTNGLISEDIKEGTAINDGIGENQIKGQVSGEDIKNQDQEYLELMEVLTGDGFKLLIERSTYFGYYIETIYNNPRSLIYLADYSNMADSNSRIKGKVLYKQMSRLIRISLKDEILSVINEKIIDNCRKSIFNRLIELEDIEYSYKLVDESSWGIFVGLLLEKNYVNTFIIDESIENVQFISVFIKIIIECIRDGMLSELDRSFDHRIVSLVRRNTEILDNATDKGVPIRNTYGFCNKNIRSVDYLCSILIKDKASGFIREIDKKDLINMLLIIDHLNEYNKYIESIIDENKYNGTIIHIIEYLYEINNINDLLEKIMDSGIYHINILNIIDSYSDMSNDKELNKYINRHIDSKDIDNGPSSRDTGDGMVNDLSGRDIDNGPSSRDTNGRIKGDKSTNEIRKGLFKTSLFASMPYVHLLGLMKKSIEEYCNGTAYSDIFGESLRIIRNNSLDGFLLNNMNYKMDLDIDRDDDLEVLYYITETLRNRRNIEKDNLLLKSLFNVIFKYSKSHTTSSDVIDSSSDSFTDNSPSYTNANMPRDSIKSTVPIKLREVIIRNILSIIERNPPKEDPIGLLTEGMFTEVYFDVYLGVIIKNTNDGNFEEVIRLAIDIINSFRKDLTSIDNDGDDGEIDEDDGEMSDAMGDDGDASNISMSNGGAMNSDTSNSNNKANNHIVNSNTANIANTDIANNQTSQLILTNQLMFFNVFLIELSHPDDKIRLTELFGEVTNEFIRLFSEVSLINGKAANSTNSTSTNKATNSTSTNKATNSTPSNLQKTLLTRLLTVYHRQFFFEFSVNKSYRSYKRLQEYTRRYISPIIIDKELRMILRLKKDIEDDSLKISINKGSLTISKIKLEYQIEEYFILIEFNIPLSYPLELITIGEIKNIGIKKEKWKLIILNTKSVLCFSTATIAESIILWKDNIEKYFEGVDPCPICYSIIDINDKIIPNRNCCKCKNTFHNKCIIEWFKRDNRKSCPMCRSTFLG